MLADSIVTKNYMGLLENFVPKNVDILEEYMPSDNIGLFKVDKIVYNKNENNLQKLINTYVSTVGAGNNLVLLIKSNSKKVDIYLGITGSKDDSGFDIRFKAKKLYKNFMGNFPGSLEDSDLPLLDMDPVNDLIDDCFNSKYNYVSSVSGVGSAREQEDVDNINYIQGIEKNDRYHAG